jgi:hypothetical protein
MSLGENGKQSNLLLPRKTHRVGRKVSALSINSKNNMA